MKKMFLAMAASACGICASPATEPDAIPESGKILVAYYSWSGNTRSAAEAIHREVGGTLFEIKPVKAYPKDFAACVRQAREECGSGFRPELAGRVENMAEYRLIFVGSPNWCGTIAPPVASFLNAYEFKGKTIIPFVTHGTGGLQNCERDMRRMCPDAAFKKTGAFSGDSVRRSNAAVGDWASKIIAGY